MTGLIFFQEESVVEPGGYDSACQRTGPVDAVLYPVVRGEGGAKGAGRVHGGAGDGFADEDAHGDGESRGETGDVMKRAARVDGGGERRRTPG